MYPYTCLATHLAIYLPVWIPAYIYIYRYIDRDRGYRLIYKYMSVGGYIYIKDLYPCIYTIHIIYTKVLKNVVEFAVYARVHDAC